MVTVGRYPDLKANKGFRRPPGTAQKTPGTASPSRATATSDGTEIQRAARNPEATLTAMVFQLRPQAFRSKTSPSPQTDFGKVSAKYAVDATAAGTLRRAGTLQKQAMWSTRSTLGDAAEAGPKLAALEQAKARMVVVLIGAHHAARRHYQLREPHQQRLEIGRQGVGDGLLLLV